MRRRKKISEMTPEEIKGAVKREYRKVAQRSYTSCCESPKSNRRDVLEKKLGYSLKGLPLSVTGSFAGCGNPVALASLQKEETVLDLGSGAGLDVFVASRKVTEKGRVIGVDMTPEMVQKANENAAELGMKNVEFRLGDIENLPVEDNSVDVIISNCVINLTPDKAKAFREAFRVLRPGGRMMISDIVLNAPLPKRARDDLKTYTGCLGGAIQEDEYLQLVREAGFEGVKVIGKSAFCLGFSANILAHKPTM